MNATYVASTTATTTSTARLWYGLNGQGQVRRLEVWAVGGVSAKRPVVYIATTAGSLTPDPISVFSYSLIDGHTLNGGTGAGAWYPAVYWDTVPQPSPATEPLYTDPTYSMYVTNTTGNSSLVATGHWNYQWPEGAGPTCGSAPLVGDPPVGPNFQTNLVVVFEVEGAVGNTATAGVNIFWEPLVES